MAARKRVSEMTGSDPMGASHVPYDQTDPAQQVSASMGGGGAPDVQGALQGSLPASSMPQGLAATPPDLGLGPDGQPAAGGGMLGQVGGGGAAPPGGAPDPSQGGMTSDQMTGDQLAALSQPLQDLASPEEQAINQMDQALNDPTIPPDQKQQLHQILDLAARRRMAGMQSQGASPLGGA